MGHFTTAGKSFPDGGTIPGFAGLDHLSFGTPAAPDSNQQDAPEFVVDGGVIKQFLFWDTGRRIVTKRRVRWTFTNASSWTSWPAVAWYGQPGGNGPGEQTLEVDSYWPGNGQLSATAIESVSATNGPGGEAAWPYQGNDHRVHTEWGAGSIDAKDHLSAGGGAVLNFSSLTKLVFGGSTSPDVFDESDADIPPGGVLTGVENITGQSVPFVQGEGGYVLAAYVTPVPTKFIPLDPDDWRDWRRVWPWEKVFDPATLLDMLRSSGLGEQIGKVRESAGQPMDEIDKIVSSAAAMTKSQLTKALAETRSMVARGEAALKSLQAQIDKQR
jgi:hypothetical protein